METFILIIVILNANVPRAVESVANYPSKSLCDVAAFQINTAPAQSKFFSATAFCVQGPPRQ